MKVKAFHFKYVVLAAAVLFALPALAYDTYHTGTSGYTSPYTPQNTTSDYNSGSKNYLTGALGFFAPGYNLEAATSNGPTTATLMNSGFIGIGADYDYMYKKFFSFGGLVRYYNVSTTINDNTIKDSMFVLGPQVKGYIQTADWIAYMTSGFEYMSPDVTRNGVDFSISSSIGWMWGIGMLYKVNDNFSIGLENMKLIGLAASSNGILLDDYMVKARFALGQ